MTTLAIVSLADGDDCPWDLLVRCGPFTARSGEGFAEGRNVPLHVLQVSVFLEAHGSDWCRKIQQGRGDPADGMGQQPGDEIDRHLNYQPSRQGSFSARRSGSGRGYPGGAARKQHGEWLNSSPRAESPRCVPHAHPGFLRDRARSGSPDERHAPLLDRRDRRPMQRRPGRTPPRSPGTAHEPR